MHLLISVSEDAAAALDMASQAYKRRKGEFTSHIKKCVLTTNMMPTLSRCFAFSWILLTLGNIGAAFTYTAKDIYIGVYGLGPQYYLPSLPSVAELRSGLGDRCCKWIVIIFKILHKAICLSTAIEYLISVTCNNESTTFNESVHHVAAMINRKIKFISKELYAQNLGLVYIMMHDSLEQRVAKLLTLGWNKYRDHLLMLNGKQHRGQDRQYMLDVMKTCFATDTSSQAYIQKAEKRVQVLKEKRWWTG